MLSPGPVTLTNAVGVKGCRLIWDRVISCNVLQDPEKYCSRGRRQVHLAEPEGLPPITN